MKQSEDGLVLNEWVREEGFGWILYTSGDLYIYLEDSKLSHLPTEPATYMLRISRDETYSPKNRFLGTFFFTAFDDEDAKRKAVAVIADWCTNVSQVHATDINVLKTATLKLITDDNDFEDVGTL